jgi:protein SCO1
MTRLAFLLPVLAAVAVAGCGSSSSGSTTTSTGAQVQHPKATFAGATATPRRAAPALELRDSLGQSVNVRAYRGKVVLVTFLYTHCPDVCPLIAGHLHTALTELGAKAKNVQIIAVSTDPRGDNPRTVAAFLKAHRMTGRMKFLIGTAGQLAPVWRRWNVISHRDPKNPELVAHSAFIYGISASGKLTTLYPSNFQPRDIVHDVPLLQAL